jgi:hypothetical protein
LLPDEVVPATGLPIAARGATSSEFMPTDAEFQALLKRVEELEAFKEAAAQGLVNHMEGIHTHDKLIIELQERSKATVENLSKVIGNLTTHVNRNHR